METGTMPGRLFCRLFVERVLILGVAVGGCQIQAPEPPPGLDLIVNQMEYFSQAEVRTTLEVAVPDLFVASSVPFRSAAAIDFSWIPNDLSLPATLAKDQLGASEWPPVGNIQEYADYARARRNTLRGFGTFFVAHLFGNPIPASGTCPGFTYGVTSGTGVPNQVVTDTARRFTFIFLTDLNRIVSECAIMGMPTGWSGFNVLVAAVAHEAGHQRAGLTHPNEYLAYHHGIYGAVPAKQADVMRNDVPVDTLGLHRFPAFDRLDQYPHEGDTTTCQGILYIWRSITN